MWREVRRTRKVKPVIVSLGNIAGSGGYYVACAGDEILAQPMTLTGSIGIYTGKFDLSGLMEKAGLGMTSFAKGRRVLMQSFDRPYTPEERTFILSRLQYFYRRFLRAVSEGRKMTQDEVHEVAKGRVWTGHQAIKRRLVDARGGLIEALALAKRRAGISPAREVRYVVLPKPEAGLLRRAAELLRGAAPPLELPRPIRRLLRGVPPVLFRVEAGEPLARIPYHIEP
jgi:protease-4